MLGEQLRAGFAGVHEIRLSQVPGQAGRARRSSCTSADHASIGRYHVPRDGSEPVRRGRRPSSGEPSRSRMRSDPNRTLRRCHRGSPPSPPTKAGCSAQSPRTDPCGFARFRDRPLPRGRLRRDRDRVPSRASPASGSCGGAAGRRQAPRGTRNRFGRFTTPRNIRVVSSYAAAPEDELLLRNRATSRTNPVTDSVAIRRIAMASTTSPMAPSGGSYVPQNSSWVSVGVSA